MINLLFDQLKLIAQIRHISDYENKSKEDLTKALSKTKPKPKTKTKPKPETPKTETKPQITKPEPKPQTPKPVTPKSKPKTAKPQKSKPQTPKPKLEPKPEIRLNQRKLKKIRKHFDELRYKFSKKEIKQ